MAGQSSKRRSARQLAGRKRSVYYEPTTDDENVDLVAHDEEQVESDLEPDSRPSQSLPRSKRRKMKSAPRRETRLKVKSKERWLESGKGRRRDAKPRKKKKYPITKTLLTPSKKKIESMTYTGPSDNKTPDWSSLPIEILRDIFIFASQPMLEFTVTATANISWLMKSARTCHAFGIPALEAYYQSPALLNTMAPHLLLELLLIPKNRLFTNYAVKVKRLEIDVRSLSYSAHSRGRLDVAALVRTTSQLQHLEIQHPADTPPYRKVKFQHWEYPRDLFDALDASNIRLRSFRWSRNMMPTMQADEIYAWVTRVHTSNCFDRLKRLVVCGFNVEDSAEPLPEADSSVRPPNLASAVSTLPALRDLTFVSCDVVMEDFLQRIPPNLERLELSNCLEVTSEMITAYLAVGGSQLRELVLNHNPSLNLSFLQSLRGFSPRLEVLKMDLTYYSEKHNSNDAWAMYDHLLAAGDHPLWPSTLCQLELLNLQKWEAEAGRTLFGSLVDQAKDLPELRQLVIQAHINIPWRDRAGFRDHWIERLQRVFLRKREDPNLHWGSLKQFRQWKQGQNSHQLPNGTPSKKKEAEASDSDFEVPARRRFSHVRITPRKPSADVETYPDIEPTPEKRVSGRPRRSVRVAESQSAASTAAEESPSESEEDDVVESQDEANLFVQGLCQVVDIRIDNQRPRENQYTEANFLDSEPSGDEDWHSGAELSDDGLAESMRSTVARGWRSVQQIRWATNGCPIRSGRQEDLLCLERKRYTSRRASSIAVPFASQVQHDKCHTNRLWSSNKAVGIKSQPEEATIYALSTAPGRAAIAIIRISGSAAVDIYKALCPAKKLPRPRHATLRTIYGPSDNGDLTSILDTNALAIYFPAPRTVTGEDVLELHIHGGPAVVKAVLAAIPRCKVTSPTGVIRYAEPGEFTRRAFMNDRLDLTQVESLGDTLSATTEQQRRLSVRGTTNQLSKRYEEWRRQLLYARGELEALIDFSEDQHFDESPGELCASVSEQVRTLKALLRMHSENAIKGELLRHGISLSLLGAPNAGKSSLLNCIVGREAAIVSQEAGTTRDIVEVGLDIGGYFCRLSDTAGLRKAILDAAQGGRPSGVIGHIEQEGMRRSRQRAEESDMVILVLSLEDSAASFQLHLDPEVVATAAKLVKDKNNVLAVINKMDLCNGVEGEQGAVQAILQALPGLDRDRIQLVSCKEREQYSPALMHEHARCDPGNIQAFLQGLIRQFQSMTAAVTSDMADDGGDPSIWQDSLGASERHRLLLDNCTDYLDAFLEAVNLSTATQDATEGGSEGDIVVAAEHLRNAADCLAKITGKGKAGDVEEVLGVVFEKFCVGK